MFPQNGRMGPPAIIPMRTCSLTLEGKRCSRAARQFKLHLQVDFPADLSCLYVIQAQLIRTKCCFGRSGIHAGIRNAVSWMFTYAACASAWAAMPTLTSKPTLESATGFSRGVHVRPSQSAHMASSCRLAPEAPVDRPPGLCICRQECLLHWTVKRVIALRLHPGRLNVAQGCAFMSCRYSSARRIPDASPGAPQT